MALAFVLMIQNGCASKQHMRETLQREHPDCFVEPDLNIVCPDPFANIDTATEYLTEKTKPNKGNEHGKSNEPIWRRRK